MNETILGMLKTLDESKKSKWKDSLNIVTHAYNCTKNSATGFSPYLLMYGRHPILPIDLILKTERERKQPTTHKDYLKKIKDIMQEAYKLAQRSSQKQQKVIKKDTEERNALVYLKEETVY